MMFSRGVTMLIFSLTMGRTPLTAVPVWLMIRSMKVSFIVFTGLCCAGIFASLSRGIASPTLVRLHRVKWVDAAEDLF